MTDSSTNGHADPRVEQLVAACLDEADRFTRGVVDRVCADNPNDADTLRRRYDALRASGLVVQGAFDGAEPDPWSDGARAAVSDPDAAKKYDAIGPYQPLKELGRGGQAVVFLAEDLRLHRPVALKVLKGLGPLSETVMNRFKREAEVASKLDHPGICAVYDAGVTDQVPYIAMRFVEGETLGDRIATARDRDASGSATKPEIHRVLETLEKAARALHVAHEAGIVHRDIKPGNIMVTPGGEPVLLDFGLAGDEDGGLQTLTETGDMLGTPVYMSPEQLMAKRIRLDRRTDVYSLGVTLFECLTHERPFSAKTRDAMYQAIQYKDPTDVRSLNPALPADLKVVIETALEKDRDKRYQTADDFADDLARVRTGEPISARRVSAPGRAWRWAKRRPMRASLAAALVVGAPLLTALLGHVIANRPAVLEAERQARLDEIERHLEAGYGELAHGDPKVALAAFDAALKMESTSGEAIGGKALALYRSRDYAACLKYLDESGTVEGGEWAMHRVRIDALRKLGRDGAADDLDKRETAEPKTALGFFLAGQQLMKGCQTHEDKDVFRRAYAYLQRAALTAPHARLLYHLELAHAARHLREETEVRHAAGSLLTLWPGSARAVNKAARTLVEVDPPAAIVAFGKAIELKSDYATAHMMLAGTLRGQRRIDDAFAACKTALELNPRNAETHNLLGLVLRDRGDLDGAIAAYRNALDLNPKHAVAHSNLGIALRERGRFKEAETMCRRAVDLAPGRAMMHANYACALNGVGRYDEALAAVDRAFELDPNSSTAYHNRAEALGGKGKVNEAIAVYEKAIALRPDSTAIANNNLGSLLERQGRHKEAIVRYRKAIEQQPDNATYHFNLGMALSRDGQDAAAIATLDKASELAPNDGFLHDSRGSALAEKGDLDGAIAAYRRAIECAPNNAAYHNNLGWGLLKKREFEAALAACNDAIQLNPSYASAHNNRAFALLYLGRVDEAITAYEKVIEVKADLQTHRNLAAVFKELGRLDDAVATLRDAVELSPRHAAYRDLAAALNDAGELDEAIATYGKSLKVRPQCWNCLDKLGHVYRRKGEFERAIRCFKKALSLNPKRTAIRTSVDETEKLLALEPELAAIIAGEVKPADANRAVLFAKLAHFKQHWVTSTRLWRETFHRDAELATGFDKLYAFWGAIAAAMAGSGHGEDVAALEAGARRDLRRQAVRWLEALRAAFAVGLENGTLSPAAVHGDLRSWTWVRYFAGIRDEAALAKLPAEERAACEAFWARVRALVARTKNKK